MGDAPPASTPEPYTGAPARPGLERYRAGMCAVFGEGAAARGGRVLLRAASTPRTALPAIQPRCCGPRSPPWPRRGRRGVPGRGQSARRRRVHGPEALLPQALEHLAYGELRAGRTRAPAPTRVRGCSPPTGGPAQRGRPPARRARARRLRGGPAVACADHADAAAPVRRSARPDPGCHPRHLGDRPRGPGEPEGPPRPPHGSSRWSVPDPGAGTSRPGCSAALLRGGCGALGPRTPRPRRPSRSSRCGPPEPPTPRPPPNWPAAGRCWLLPEEAAARYEEALAHHAGRAATSRAPARSCSTGSGCAGSAGPVKRAARCATPWSPSNAAAPGLGRPRAGELRAAGEAVVGPDQRRGPAGPADPAAAAHRPLRGGGRHQPRGGDPALIEPAHRRPPSAERLRRAGSQVPDRARTAARPLASLGRPRSASVGLGRIVPGASGSPAAAPRGVAGPAGVPVRPVTARLQDRDEKNGAHP